MDARRLNLPVSKCYNFFITIKEAIQVKPRSFYSVTALALALLLMAALLCGCASGSKTAAKTPAASPEQSNSADAAAEADNSSSAEATSPMDAAAEADDSSRIEFHENETAVIFQNEDGLYSAVFSLTGDYPGLDMAITAALMEMAEENLASVIGTSGDEITSVFFENGEILDSSSVPSSWQNYEEDLRGQYAGELDLISQFFGKGNYFTKTYAAGAGFASSVSGAGFEPFVAYSENDITVTFTALEVDPVWGPEISVMIENNTDQNITVQAKNTSVNGAMIETIFSCDVAAGKKANDSISFYSEDLELAGITEIYEIELSLLFFNSETWADIDLSDPILIYTDAGPNTQTFDDSGSVAYDVDGVRIVVKGLIMDGSYHGADVLLYIENNTDQNLTVQARDVSVNGIMLDPIFSSDVYGGKVAFDMLTFLKTDLEDNAIDDIESIELRFEIFDAQTWNDVAESDLITITFE